MRFIAKLILWIFFTIPMLFITLVRIAFKPKKKK